jgi:hypothetical protein
MVAHGVSHGFAAGNPKSPQRGRKNRDHSVAPFGGSRSGVPLHPRLTPGLSRSAGPPSAANSKLPICLTPGYSLAVLCAPAPLRWVFPVLPRANDQEPRAAFLRWLLLLPCSAFLRFCVGCFLFCREPKTESRELPFCVGCCSSLRLEACCLLLVAILKWPALIYAGLPKAHKYQQLTRPRFQELMR